MDNNSTKNKLENVQNQQTGLYFPMRTNILLKKTSLLLDELEIRRCQEQAIRPTQQEYETHEKMKDVFKTQMSSEQILDALESEKQLRDIRKEYLIAAKIQREKEIQKDAAEQDNLGILLLATGTPIVLIGMTLMSMFKIAGIVVIGAGAAMYIPAFIREVTRKRKARKEYKKITKKVDSLSDEIHEKTAHVDSICNKYGLPVNNLDKEARLETLSQAAMEYERIDRKKTDYELLVSMNKSNAISSEISENIRKLSGLTDISEIQYKEVVAKLERQLGENLMLKEKNNV